jgi:hypothetical protein
VLAPPFPAPPNFDALSTFEVKGRWSALRSRSLGGSLVRDIDVHVDNVVPLRYASIASRADAVARSVRGYAVTYAGDDGGVHLRLEPGAAYFRDHTQWLRDVWYDPATMLPTRIMWNGNDHLVLDARYAAVNGGGCCGPSTSSACSIRRSAGSWRCSTARRRVPVQRHRTGSTARADARARPFAVADTVTRPRWPKDLLAAVTIRLS